MTKSAERGQSLVEFAVVFPIFMALLAGMLQFGVVLWGQNTLNQAVRDTGRFAATLDCSAAAAVAAEDRFSNTTNGILKQAGGPWTAPTVDVVYLNAAQAPTIICPVDSTEVVWVKVTATANAPIFFPFIPANGTLGSTTMFRVEPQP